MLLSTTVRSPSTSTGNIANGQWRSHSAAWPPGAAGSRLRSSYGVPFSCSAVSTFWVYDEKGWP
jgi:hypothetical protein